MSGQTLARIAAAAWAAAIVFVIALAALAPAAAASVEAHGPACPVRSLFGIDCPFCGMTRASIALGRGELRAALAYHPLAVIVLPGMLALLAIVALGRTEWLLRGRRPQLLLAGIAVVWITRLVLG